MQRNLMHSTTPGTNMGGLESVSRVEQTMVSLFVTTDCFSSLHLDVEFVERPTSLGCSLSCCTCHIIYCVHVIISLKIASPLIRLHFIKRHDRLSTGQQRQDEAEVQSVGSGKRQAEQLFSLSCMLVHTRERTHNLSSIHLLRHINARTHTHTHQSR